MTEQDQIKKKLIEQLDKVKLSLQTLGMIERKLLNIKDLAERVLEEDLTDKEIQELNQQVQALVAEVDLLARQPTQLS